MLFLALMKRFSLGLKSVIDVIKQNVKFIAQIALHSLLWFFIFLQIWNYKKSFQNSF